MSNSFGRVLAMAGSACNEHFDSCHIPIFISRGTTRTKPAMEAAALYARNIARPALQSVVLYFLVIVISIMAVAKPADASGTVSSGSLASTGSCINIPVVNANYDAFLACVVADTGAAYAWINMVGECARCDVRTTFAVDSTGHCPVNSGCSGSYRITYTTGCPVHSQSAGNTCTCTDPYVADPAGTSCVLLACPDNASRTSPGAPCACDTDYKFDAAGTSCVRKCTIDPLPKLPFKGDVNPACTESLEQGKGKDVRNVCPQLNPKMTEPNGGQMQCLADKINKLALTPAYTGPSATIRTEAYQKHLLAIWEKSIEIEDADLSFDMEQKCADEIADAAHEKKTHGIDALPSKKGSYAPHVQGIALDIPREVAKAMMAKLTNVTVVVPVNCFLGTCMPIPVHIGDVQDYVNSPTVNPPACDLLWGGSFNDKVHFQLQHP